MSLERSFFGPPCIVVYAAVHSYQPCKKVGNIHVMFQLDKLTVIVAQKQRCPIRLRGAIAIKALSDTAICPPVHPFVCPSPRCAAAQGAQLPLSISSRRRCLQLSQVWTADPSADGRRSAASRTAIGCGAYRPAARGAITV